MTVVGFLARRQGDGTIRVGAGTRVTTGANGHTVGHVRGARDLDDASLVTVELDLDPAELLAQTEREEGHR